MEVACELLLDTDFFIAVDVEEDADELILVVEELEELTLPRTAKIKRVEEMMCFIVKAICLNYRPFYLAIAMHP